MNKSVVALVPAAGNSTRAPGLSKILVEIRGQSVIARTVCTLISHPLISRVVVMTRADIEGDVLEEVRRIQTNKPIDVILGGPSRQESVMNGLLHLAQQPNDIPDYVLVHDGARCLVTFELIERVANAAFENRAATLAIKVTDTLAVSSASGLVNQFLDRESTWAIQTPQVFEFELLLKGHRSANRLGFTDDASIVLPIAPVQIVEGDKKNIKITTVDDFRLAAMLEE